MDRVQVNNKFIEDLKKLRDGRNVESRKFNYGVGRAQRFNTRLATRAVPSNADPSSRGLSKTRVEQLSGTSLRSLDGETKFDDIEPGRAGDLHARTVARDAKIELLPLDLVSSDGDSKRVASLIGDLKISRKAECVTGDESAYDFFTLSSWPTSVKRTDNSATDLLEEPVQRDFTEAIRNFRDVDMPVEFHIREELGSCEYSSARNTLSDKQYQQFVANNTFLVNSSGSDIDGHRGRLVQNDAETALPSLSAADDNAVWPVANRNRMLCRFMRQNEISSWFDGNAGFKANLYPVAKKCFRRPDEDSGENSYLTAPLRHAVEPWKISALIANRPNVFGLNVNIHSVRFRHHQLMNTENVIERRLVNTMEIFKKLNFASVQETLRTRIDRLKSAVANSAAAQPTLPEAEHDDDENILRSKVKLLLQNLLDTRVQLDREFCAEQDMLAVVLELWKMLSDHRKRPNGFTSTATILRLTRIDADAEQDLRSYRSSFDEEVNERRLLSQLLYEAQVHDYQLQVQRKKEAKHRLRDSTLAGFELSREDLRILHDEPEPIKPQPPPSEDAAIIQAVKTRIVGSRRQPGSPIIQPRIVLAHANTSDADLAVVVTPNAQCPKEEQHRRRLLARTRVEVKISVSDRLVTTLQPQAIDAVDFSVTFKSLTPIYVQQPAPVKVDIVESPGGSAASSRVLSTVFIPPPPTTAAYDGGTDDDTAIAYSDIEFTTSDTSRVTIDRTNAVGSGVQVNIFDAEKPELLLTGGVVKCRTFWSNDDVSKITQQRMPLDAESSELDRRFDSMRTRGVCSSQNDIKVLREWLAETQQNNDSSTTNADDDELKQLVERFLAVADAAASDDAKPFRDMQTEFDFCADEDMHNSPRFRLLQIRDAGAEPDFRNIKMIPPTDRQIDALAFGHLLNRRANRADKIFSNGTDDFGDKNDGKVKLEFLRYLDRLCEHVHCKLRAISQKLDNNGENTETRQKLAQIVYEDDISSLRTLFSVSEGPSLFSQRRPLKPTTTNNEKRLQKVAVDTEAGAATGDAQLHVRIERSFNLPIRAGVMPPNSQSAVALSNPANTSTTQFLQPFVEIKSNGKLLVRTSVADGPQPLWSEQHTVLLNKIVQLDVGAELSWVELSRIHWEISVFDQIAVDVIDADLRRDNYIHKRLQRHWLCSKRMPLLELIYTTHSNGLLRLEMPSVLVGYYALPTRPTGVSLPAAINDVVSPQQPTIEMYFAVAASLIPKSGFPASLVTKLDSVETPQTLHAIDMWLNELHRRRRGPDDSSTNSTYLPPLAVTTDGTAALWCRYVAPLEPPKIILEKYFARDPLQRMQAVAYYVSLFPVMPFVGYAFVVGGFQVFLNNEQFVTMKIGAARQHALLLLGYFSFLKVPEVFLLVSVASASKDMNNAMLSYHVITHGFPSSATPDADSGAASNSAAVIENHHRFSNSYLVWDACDGKMYTNEDAACPVENVLYLVSSTNVYANIQLGYKATQLDFRVNLTANWLPLFDGTGSGAELTVRGVKRRFESQRASPPDLRSLQPPAFVYDDIDADWCEEIQDSIKHRLVEQITSRRGVALMTRWNRQLSMQLRVLIRDMEQTVIDNSGVDAENVTTTRSSLFSKHMVALQQFVPNNKSVGIYGYLIHVPKFTSVSAICNRLLSTEIYAVESSRAEFGVAVHCTAYPAKILSVWAYIVTLIFPDTVD